MQAQKDREIRIALLKRGLVILLLVQMNLLAGFFIYWTYEEINKPPSVENTYTESKIVCEKEVNEDNINNGTTICTLTEEKTRK